MDRTSDGPQRSTVARIDYQIEEVVSKLLEITDQPGWTEPTGPSRSQSPDYKRSTAGGVGTCQWVRCSEGLSVGGYLAADPRSNALAGIRGVVSVSGQGLRPERWDGTWGPVGLSATGS